MFEVIIQIDIVITKELHVIIVVLQIIVNITQQNFLYMGGGQDKPAWTACPPGVKITRAGVRYPGTACPPGGANQPRLACPPGGKLSRGQDKLGHRYFFFFLRCKATFDVTSYRAFQLLDILLTNHKTVPKIKFY